MSKAVTKKEETAVSTEVVNPLASVGLNIQDMLLPALAVRQNSYLKDKMKPFRPGEIVIFPEGKAVGGEGVKVTFIPVSIEKLYRICDVSEKQARTVGWESWTTDLPWEFERDGRAMRRDKSYVAHILLREGLDAQSAMLERASKGEFVDPSDFALPVRVIFTRGGLNAGKVLSTHFEMSKLVRQTPAAVMFNLFTKEVKNDKGTFYVYECEKVSDPKLKYTDKTVLPIANRWATALENSASRLRADETALEEVTVVDTKVTESDRF